MAQLECAVGPSMWHFICGSVSQCGAHYLQSSNHPLPSKFCNDVISTTKPSSTSMGSGCLNSLSTHSQFSEPAPCTCTSAASQERHLHRISPLSSQEAKDCDYSIQSSTVMQVTSLSESCHSEKETKI